MVTVPGIVTNAEVVEKGNMRHCYVLRVFTRQGLGGNHLGVVTDTTGLAEDVMQSVAADLAFSETVFLDWNNREVPHARIFTPTREMPFAGHPLVGAAWTLLALGPGGATNLTCQVGSIGISFDGTAAWIDAPLDQPVAAVEDFVADDLGLPAPVTVVEVAMPLRYVLAELRDPHQVSAYVPNAKALARTRHGEHLYVWARTGDRVRARFFAPASGVFEDPATGSAAVALARALQAAGQESGSLLIEQGEEIGHPSDIQLAWTSGQVRLGGAVVRDEVRLLDV